MKNTLFVILFLTSSLFATDTIKSGYSNGLNIKFNIKENANIGRQGYIETKVEMTFKEDCYVKTNSVITLIDNLKISKGPIMLYVTKGTHTFSGNGIFELNIVKIKNDKYICYNK